MQVSSIIDLDRRAKEFGRARTLRRSLFASLRAETGRHFIGIIGPRGAGKTILLQQLAATAEDGIYLSLDTLPRDLDLFSVVKELADQYH